MGNYQLLPDQLVELELELFKRAHLRVRFSLERKLRTSTANAYSSVGCAFAEQLLELTVVALGFWGRG